MKTITQKLREKYSLRDSMDSVKDIIVPRFMRLSLEKAITRFNSFPDEYRTDWNKLLMDVDKSKGVLSNLIKSLFGQYDGDIVGLYELDMSLCKRDVTMIFANTKDMKEQRKLVDITQQTLGNNYLVELINSEETNNREVENKVQKLINRAKKENKKIVLISKDMASRSFSISEIDTIILMFDRGSYATISQKISRVLTPGKTLNGDTKVYGDIISLSLDPNRENLSPIDEYIICESERVEVDDLNDGIHRVLRSVQLFTNGEHGEVEIEKDNYADELINSSSLVRLSGESTKPENIISDTELVNTLLGLKLTLGESEKIDGVDSSTIIRTNGGNIDKKEVQQLEKKLQDYKVKLKEIMKNIVENVVEISEINNCESDDIIETLCMIETKGLNDEIVHEVGVDCNTILKIIQMGGISKKLMNTIITSYNHQEVELF
jgi:hypothetical protein